MKFCTKYLTHAVREIYFMLKLNFKSFQIEKLESISETVCSYLDN